MGFSRQKYWSGWSLPSPKGRLAFVNILMSVENNYSKSWSKTVLTYILWFYVYDISRTGKSTERESRLVIALDWWRDWIDELPAWKCCDYFLDGNNHFFFFFFLLTTSPSFPSCSVTQSCPALCDSMNCSLPGSSVHGILQARILEWVAIPFSRGSSWPRNWTQVSCVSCIAGCFFTAEPPGKPKGCFGGRLGFREDLEHGNW